MATNAKNLVQMEENKLEENEEPASPTEKGEQASNKMSILFHNVGNAPKLKKRKWLVEPEKKMGAICLFLRKFLKLSPSDNLFLYVNQAFAPSPDQTMKNLFECYGVEGTLNIHYCMSQAWG